MLGTSPTPPSQQSRRNPTMGGAREVYRFSLSQSPSDKRHLLGYPPRLSPLTSRRVPPPRIAQGPVERSIRTDPTQRRARKRAFSDRWLSPLTGLDQRLFAAGAENPLAGLFGAAALTSDRPDRVQNVPLELEPLDTWWTPVEMLAHLALLGLIQLAVEEGIESLFAFFAVEHGLACPLPCPLDTHRPFGGYDPSYCAAARHPSSGTRTRAVASLARLFPQELLEASSRTIQARHDRTDRDIEDVGDLPIRKPFHVGQ